MKKVYIFFALIALLFCACSRVEEMPLLIQDEAPVIYQMDIKVAFNPETRGVSFGADGVTITSEFEETDCIYVYNETKQAFARSLTSATVAPLIALHPSNFSENYCDLSGSLSFYVWDEDLGDFGEWKVISVDEGDTYSLFYKMNNPSAVSSSTPLFDYSFQDGSASTASALDFAVVTGVTMTKSASTLTAPEGVVLSNIQSMFRLRLSYTDEESAPIATAPTITAMTVSTANGTLVYWYEPTDTGDEYDMDLIPLDTPVVFSENNDIYLSLSFHYDSTHPAADDELILTAKDSDNNIYKGVITVPSGGFSASNYYYGALTMEKQVVGAASFNVYRKVGDELTNLNLTVPDVYYISVPDGVEYVLEGSCSGYAFDLSDNSATIILAGDENPVTATWEGSGAPFIWAETDLTVVLDCDYVIYCPNRDEAIWAGELTGNLKLETTGGTRTLSVTVPHYEGSYPHYGIYGEDNYWRNQVAQDLAVDGFAVTRSGGPDSNGETDTWVYTVTPNP